MPSTTSRALRAVYPSDRKSWRASSPTAPAVSRAVSVNRRTPSSRSSARGCSPGVRRAVTSSGAASSETSLAVCISTQMWHALRVAIVMTTTSRDSGSRVLDSKAALAWRKPPSVSGDVASRATADGTRPPCFLAIASMVRRAAGGAESMV